MSLYVTYIHLSIKHIHYTTRSILKIQKNFLRSGTEGSIILGAPVLIDATAKNNQLLKPCIGSPHQSSHLNKLWTSADR